MPIRILKKKEREPRRRGRDPYAVQPRKPSMQPSNKLKPGIGSLQKADIEKNNKIKQVKAKFAALKETARDELTPMKSDRVFSKFRRPDSAKEFYADKPGSKYEGMAKQAMKEKINYFKNMKTGGVSKIDKLRSTKGQFTIEGRIQTLKEKLKKRFGKKTGDLTGGQVKLDKNKDGKISGEDFKMMKKKTKNPTAKENNTKPPFSRFVFDSDNKGFSKGGGSAISREKRKRDLIKKQNPISEYDKKGKLKYTAATKGAMMNKSTRGYGAARTSGMGLQDEKVKSGKVKPVKALLGIATMGLLGAKMLKDKKKKATPMVGAAAELMKKKKEILGKKTGGPISGPKGGLPRMSDMDKKRIDTLKQQFNRFRNTSTKGGGADASKIMSDKTKQSIKKLVERIGRLTPAAKIGSDAGKILKEKLKKKIMTPAKKMGGGMMMKQYNKGGSVTASCKLGRNKATKLY